MTLSKIIDLIRAELDRQGTNPYRAAINAGLPGNAIRYVLEGKEPAAGRLLEICAALGLETYFGPPRTEAVPEPPEVIPHYGEIGAGGGDMANDGRIYEVTGETTSTTGAPIDISPQHITRWGGLAALTVRGRSMEPLFRDGDTLYIYGDDPIAADTDRLIGRDCAVVLSGDRKGETYIKRIRRADNGKPGYFNLESINPIWHTMADVQLLQARPVRYIRRAI